MYNQCKFNIGDKVILIESRIGDISRESSKRIADTLRDKVLIIKSITPYSFGVSFLRFEDIDHSEISGINPRLFDKVDILSERKSKIDNLNNL